MGNVIRLGIARIGLALNTFWTVSGKKRKKPPVVLLILGDCGVGKSTIASRILHKGEKWEDGEAVYVPTKGFSTFELIDRDTKIRLYDLGGGEVVRELWTHYYPDAHGIIYVIDSSGGSSTISAQTEIFNKILQDERIKRKPLLIFGNKQDLENVFVESLVAQMDLVKSVNTAKCLTRIDMTSMNKIDGFEDGLMHGFRWLVGYINGHWTELNERVEQDSMLERSTENAKFEAMHHHKSASSSPMPVVKLENERKSIIGLASPRRSLNSTKDARKMSINQRQHSDEDPVVMILPNKRLDPEGGNEEPKEWKPDALHQVPLQHDTEDEYPEVVMVESRAEVHVHRSHSASAATPNSNRSIEALFSVDQPSVSLESKVICQEYEDEHNNFNQNNNGGIAVKHKIDTTKRPKLFRNKTAPIRVDQPIRIPISKGEDKA